MLLVAVVVELLKMVLMPLARLLLDPAVTVYPLALLVQPLQGLAVVAVPLVVQGQSLAVLAVAVMVIMLVLDLLEL